MQWEEGNHTQVSATHITMSLIDCANEDVWFGKKIKF